MNPRDGRGTASPRHVGSGPLGEESRSETPSALEIEILDEELGQCQAHNTNGKKNCSPLMGRVTSHVRLPVAGGRTNSGQENLRKHSRAKTSRLALIFGMPAFSTLSSVQTSSKRVPPSNKLLSSFENTKHSSEHYNAFQSVNMPANNYGTDLIKVGRNQNIKCYHESVPYLSIIYYKKHCMLLCRYTYGTDFSAQYPIY